MASPELGKSSKEITRFAIPIDCEIMLPIEIKILWTYTPKLGLSITSKVEVINCIT